MYLRSMNHLFFADRDLAESIKRNASDRLGESVLYGSSPDFSRVLSRHLASSRNSFPCTTLSYPGQPFSFPKKAKAGVNNSSIAKIGPRCATCIKKKAGRVARSLYVNAKNKR